MGKGEGQFKKMTEESVEKLIVKLSVPTVTAMLVTSFYNMADTYFVSRIGTSATGAVGVVFPLMAIIQAFGFALGMGSGSIISRLLGEQKNDEASKIASSALFFGLCLGVVLALGCSVWISDLMMFFGSTETILPYAVDYGKYIIFGAPVMIGSFIMNNILRSQGRAKYAMLGIGAGGILNVILDPIFIFNFNMGVKGAAVATLISQAVSFAILAIFFILGKTEAKISLKRISKKISDYLLIFKMGLPSLARQILASISTTVLNRAANYAAGPYSDAAVAAMGVSGKIFMIIFAILIGMGQGFQPVCGFNYGAKKYKRVRRAVLFLLGFGFVAMTVLAIPVLCFPDWFMSQFTVSDEKVIEIGKVALRAQALILPIIPISTVANMTYQTVGRSWTATLLSATRQGIFFIPAVLIMSKTMGLLGVQWAQAVADILSSLFCLPFLIKFLRELKEQEKLA